MSLQIQSPAFGIGSEAAVINSYMSSVKFLKQVIPFAIATLLNRRCDFNPEYLKVRMIENVSYYSFKSIIPRTHCTFKLIASSKLIQEHIEQKQLQEIYFEIVNRESGKCLEEYTFVFDYSSKDIVNEQCKEGMNMAKRFFENIANIPKGNYQEADIVVQYGLKFFNTTPKELIASYHPATLTKHNSCFQEYARFNTNYHKVKLYGSIVQVQSPTSREVEEIFSDTNVTNIEKVNNPLSISRLSSPTTNSQILRPLRRKSPKIKTKLFRQLKDQLQDADSSPLLPYKELNSLSDSDLLDDTLSTLNGVLTPKI